MYANLHVSAIVKTSALFHCVDSTNDAFIAAEVIDMLPEYARTLVRPLDNTSTIIYRDGGTRRRSIDAAVPSSDAPVSSTEEAAIEADDPDADEIHEVDITRGDNRTTTTTEQRDDSSPQNAQEPSMSPAGAAARLFATGQLARGTIRRFRRLRARSAAANRGAGKS